jgi:dolichol-phosphate mannosyltransferase
VEKDALQETPRTVSVIVPAYNEDRTVGKIIDGLLFLELFREIIVVNDGSTDRTNEVLEGYHGNIIIVNNPKNSGKGYSVLRGLEHITAPYLVLQDADLEYPIENLPKLIRYAEENHSDMVVGVRTMKETEIFKLSTTSFIANKVFRKIIGEADIFSGQRIVKTEILRAMNLRSKGFEIETEITMKALRSGATVKYIPIEYHPRKEGKKIGVLDFIKIAGVYLSLHLVS